MKFAEINEMFSAKVAEYLTNGYVMHPYTMAGHQGEIAKVDMCNGHEVIRVWLDKVHADTFHFRHGVRLTVGRCTDERLIKERGYLWEDTMWCDRMEVVEQKVFWQMNGKDWRETDWYIEGEDGIAAMKKTDDRCERKYIGNAKETHFDLSMFRIALKMVRKTPFNKTKRLADIEDFWKVGRQFEKPTYYAKVKGVRVKLA